MQIECSYKAASLSVGLKLIQLIIFPFFGVNLPLSDNLLIGAFFTIVSIIYSYTLRRFFNRKQLCKPIADMPH
ncbi:hypothetical protein FLL65_08455 [Vibrio cholerae]|uniref:DUF7220 family protein n=1 Tax=Vibrio cholerae TaxID=666 RepID=UPI0011581E84|nr:hypothetical protein [Vibrio cholerae]TQQ49313.1 hypothetical protein FLL65_08455 [Vibrio cholerae]TQQ55689.1 hypothetical protein FLL62_04320 [Vibrio cholerae]